jgi:hypothetical protein
MRRTLLPALVALSLAAPAVAVADDIKPEEQVRQVLLGRNADLRANLLRAWLVPPENADAARIRALAADVYSSEARLTALGIERPMMRDGTSLTEVPYFVLADRSRVALDPWVPLGGKSFVVPKEPAK